MNDSVEIRRRPDGSIDIEFYRVRAAQLRLQTLREGLRFNYKARLFLSVVPTVVASDAVTAVRSIY
jgi:hypothetical protein